MSVIAMLQQLAAGTVIAPHRVDGIGGIMDAKEAEAAA
jgi:hypothetical protein